MTPFSASDAAFDGFRVLGRQWRLVVGWALFNVLGLIGACVFAAILIGVAAVAATSSAAAGAIGGAVGAVVLLVCAFAVQVMIVSALFRTVLGHEASGVLQLRLGPDELRVGITWLAMMTIAVAGGGLALYLAGLAGRTGGAPAGIAALLLGAALMAWLMLRLSLAAPVAVAERRAGFGRSWRLTRGRVAALLGMSVLTLCFLAIILIAASISLALISGTATGFRDFGLLLRSEAADFAERPGFYLAQLALQFLFAPVMWVISQTPLVAAYKAFREAD